MGTVRTTVLDGSGDERETEVVLGKVLTPPPHRGSLYVEISAIDKKRRTDGGAADPNTGIEYNTDSLDEEYKRGDYVYLTFEPQKYDDDTHVLTEVERASVQAPTQVDEPKFDGTDIPITCPKCGRDGAAALKTKYDKPISGQLNDDSDCCTLDPDNRGPWFGLSSEWTIIHGI